MANYARRENGVVVEIRPFEEISTLEGDWELIIPGPGAPSLDTEPDLNIEARNWRDGELRSTDWIVPITDHSERNAYMTYRQELRDWPSSEDFPVTRPTLTI